MLMYYIENRTSTCVEAIAVSPLRKVAKVRYPNGKEYTYSNVSRLAILNLILNPSVSLGFWANKVKRANKVACKPTGFNIHRQARLDCK